jgi:hypothetical protein
MSVEWTNRSLWIDLAVGSVAVLLAAGMGFAAFSFPAEDVLDYGGMVLVGLVTAAALIALTPGMPYRPLAAGFFFVALTYVWLLSPPRTTNADFDHWLAKKLGYRCPEEGFRFVDSDHEVVLRHHAVGDLVAALWLGMSGGIALQIMVVVAAARLNWRPKRPRWHQFTLRTLAAYTLAVAIVCGIVLQLRESARKEADFVADLKATKGIYVGLYRRYTLFPWMLPWIGQSSEEVVTIMVMPRTQLSPVQWRNIGDFASITLLTVYDAQHAEESILEAIARLHNLERLAVNVASFEEGHAESLASHVRLWQLSIRGDQVDLSTLPALPELNDLEVAGVKGDLSALKRQPKLSELSVIQSTLSAHQVAQVAGAKALARVELSDIMLEEDAWAKLPAIRGLETLIFNPSQQIGDDHLASLGQCRALTQLDLSRKNVSDRGLAHLRGHPQIRTLCLEGTKVTDEGLTVLTSLPALSQLSLANTAVTDAGVARLEEAIHLEKLDLRHSAVTDNCFEHLARMPELYWVDLEETRVTREGIEAFKARRPGVVVLHDADDVSEQ